MADILQTTFPETIWVKWLFWFNLLWSIVPRVNWQYFSIGSDNGLAPNRLQTNDDPDQWLGHTELVHQHNENPESCYIIIWWNTMLMYTPCFCKILECGLGMCSNLANHRLLLGERQEAQILKFDAPPPPPTHLVCHVHLIANFLSFHMSLVVVVNCGAGNALRGFEISMFYFFLKLYFIHISKDILLLWAQNANDTFLENCNVKDYENVKLVTLSSCTAAQLSLILCMISKNSDFGVGGNVKFFTEANFILMNTKFINLNQKIIF